MKSLYDKVLEAQIDAHLIHEICLEIENVVTLTRKLDAIANAVIKKGDKNGPETISFERLWTSSTVDQLLRDACKSLGARLDRGEERAAAKKYVASMIMWEIHQSRDEWTFADWTTDDWDYNKLDW